MKRSEKSVETDVRDNHKTDATRVESALRELTPHLEEVPFTPNPEKVVGEPTISGYGFFSVKIDRRAIKTILTSCGYPIQDLAEISIIFRAARLADRNYWGQAMAGLRMDEDSGQMIEVYTSLPEDILSDQQHSAVSMTENRKCHFAFKKEAIAKAILEELRHAIQIKLGLFDIADDGSFEAEDVKKLRDVDYEEDADNFAEALFQTFLPFVEVTRLEIEGLDEMYLSEDEAREHFPRGLKAHLNPKLAAREIEPDPIGLYLTRAVDTVNLFDRSEAAVLEGKIAKALDERKIGFMEARYLYKRLIAKAEEIGDQFLLGELKSLLQDIS